MAREPLRRDGRAASAPPATWPRTAAARSSTPPRSAGSTPAPGVMTYRATKAAVIHLTRSIAIDLAEHGDPGELHRARPHPHRDQRPLRPVADHPADAAAPAPGLARATSPRPPSSSPATRAAQITGIVLPVDGGTTAGAPAATSSRRPRTAPDTKAEVSADGRRHRRLLVRRPPRPLRGAADAVGVAPAGAAGRARSRASWTRDGAPVWMCEDRVIGRSGMPATARWRRA